MSRNEVHRKFPPDMSQSNHSSRRVSEMNGGRGRGRGRGRGNGRGGRGRGGGRRGGCGCGRGHPDARWITGNDCKSYEVHASYKFHDNVWQQLPYNERQKVLEDRKQYHESRKRNASEISTNDRSSVPG